MASRLSARKRRAADRVVFAERERAVGGGIERGIVAGRDRGHRALLLQRDGVAGDGVGDLAHQGAQFADFGGDRIGRAARAVHGFIDAAFHGAEPARNLRHLAGEVAGAARQIRDLVAEIAAVAQAAADGVVQRHHNKRGERRQWPQVRPSSLTAR